MVDAVSALEAWVQGKPALRDMDDVAGMYHVLAGVWRAAVSAATPPAPSSEDGLYKEDLPSPRLKLRLLPCLQQLCKLLADATAQRLPISLCGDWAIVSDLVCAVYRVLLLGRLAPDEAARTPQVDEREENMLVEILYELISTQALPAVALCIWNMEHSAAGTVPHTGTDLGHLVVAAHKWLEAQGQQCLASALLQEVAASWHLKWVLTVAPSYVPITLEEGCSAHMRMEAIGAASKWLHNAFVAKPDADHSVPQLKWILEAQCSALRYQLHAMETWCAAAAGAAHTAVDGLGPRCDAWAVPEILATCTLLVEALQQEGASKAGTAGSSAPAGAAGSPAAAAGLQDLQVLDAVQELLPQVLTWSHSLAMRQEALLCCSSIAAASAACADHQHPHGAATPSQPSPPVAAIDNTHALAALSCVVRLCVLCVTFCARRPQLRAPLIQRLVCHGRLLLLVARCLRLAVTPWEQLQQLQAAASCINQVRAHCGPQDLEPDDVAEVALSGRVALAKLLQHVRQQPVMLFDELSAAAAASAPVDQQAPAAASLQQQQHRPAGSVGGMSHSSSEPRLDHHPQLIDAAAAGAKSPSKATGTAAAAQLAPSTPAPAAPQQVDLGDNSVTPAQPAAAQQQQQQRIMGMSKQEAEELAAKLQLPLAMLSMSSQSSPGAAAAPFSPDHKAVSGMDSSSSVTTQQANQQAVAISNGMLSSPLPVSGAAVVASITTSNTSSLKPPLPGLAPSSASSAQQGNGARVCQAGAGSIPSGAQPAAAAAATVAAAAAAPQRITPVSVLNVVCEVMRTVHNLSWQEERESTTRSSNNGAATPPTTPNAALGSSSNSSTAGGGSSSRRDRLVMPSSHAGVMQWQLLPQAMELLEVVIAQLSEQQQLMQMQQQPAQLYSMAQLATLQVQLRAGLYNILRMLVLSAWSTLELTDMPTTAETVDRTLPWQLYLGSSPAGLHLLAALLRCAAALVRSGAWSLAVDADSTQQAADGTSPAAAVSAPDAPAAKLMQPLPSHDLDRMVEDVASLAHAYFKSMDLYSPPKRGHATPPVTAPTSPRTPRTSGAGDSSTAGAPCARPTPAIAGRHLGAGWLCKSWGLACLSVWHAGIELEGAVGEVAGVPAAHRQGSGLDRVVSGSTSSASSAHSGFIGGAPAGLLIQQSGSNGGSNVAEAWAAIAAAAVRTCWAHAVHFLVQGADELATAEQDALSASGAMVVPDLSDTEAVAAYVAAAARHVLVQRVSAEQRQLRDMGVRVGIITPEFSGSSNVVPMGVVPSARDRRVCYERCAALAAAMQPLLPVPAGSASPFPVEGHAVRAPTAPAATPVAASSTPPSGTSAAYAAAVAAPSAVSAMPSASLSASAVNTGPLNSSGRSMPTSALTVALSLPPPLSDAATSATPAQEKQGNSPVGGISAELQQQQQGAGLGAVGQHSAQQQHAQHRKGSPVPPTAAAAAARIHHKQLPPGWFSSASAWAQWEVSLLCLPRNMRGCFNPHCTSLGGSMYGQFVAMLPCPGCMVARFCSPQCMQAAQQGAGAHQRTCTAMAHNCSLLL